MLDIAIYITLFLVATLVTAALIPGVKKLAVKLDAVDYPSGRRVNKRPVPRMGGLAMFLGMSAALLVMLILIWTGVWASPLVKHPMFDVDYTFTAIGVVAMFWVGIVDDIYDLSPKMKLFGQVGAAMLVAASGVRFAGMVDLFGNYIDFGLVSYPLTVVYLVAFANIINLIDGLDGLAAGISAISCTTLLVFAVLTARPDAIVFCVILIGACLGFLKYNRHPASIFMGDSGSLLLGFLLGIISLFTLSKTALLTSMVVPLIAAGVPIIDTASAIIRRIRGHQPIGEADTGHIHHRLLDGGHSHSETVRLMLVWSTALSAGGIAITCIGDPVAKVFVFTMLAIASGMVIWKLGLLKPVLAHKYNPRKSRRHMKDGTFDQDETDEVDGESSAPEDDGADAQSG